MKIKHFLFLYKNYPMTKSSNNTIALGKDITQTVIEQKPLDIKKFPLIIHLLAIYGPKFSSSINAAQGNSKGELINNINFENFTFNGNQFTISNKVYIQGYILFNCFGYVNINISDVNNNTNIDGSIYHNNISICNSSSNALNCNIPKFNSNTDSVFLKMILTKIKDSMKINVNFSAQGMGDSKSITADMFLPVDRITIKQFDRTICYKKYIKGSKCVEECDLNQSM